MDLTHNKHKTPKYKGQVFKMQIHNHSSEVYKCRILDGLWSMKGLISVRNAESQPLFWSLQMWNTGCFVEYRGQVIKMHKHNHFSEVYYSTVEILDALWYPQKKCLPLGTAVTTGSTSGGRLWWAGRVRLPYDKKPWSLLFSCRDLCCWSARGDPIFVFLSVEITQ